MRRLPKRPDSRAKRAENFLALLGMHLLLARGEGVGARGALHRDRTF